MAQIPRLSDDVLYIISEKLLFKKFCRQVDLCDTNGYTLFMFHSVKNMRALLSHFSKMKHLDLSASDNDFVIKLYKEEIPVPKHMVNVVYLKNYFFFPFLIN
ncbi:unnamed protein product [Meloidogyne enterolobii]|uniref:Uncharacterized protein n=1 Tax=Meloidogyne enterolobii TaxID=390850 RepID=A0ACB0YDN1_MELEN